MPLIQRLMRLLKLNIEIDPINQNSWLVFTSEVDLRLNLGMRGGMPKRHNLKTAISPKL